MKKIITFVGIALFILMTSCEKHNYINLGFNSPIDKNSEGLVIAHISANTEKIYLTGNINLSNGAVEISLINPNREVVFLKTLVSPNEFEINETFESKKGYWKLMYNSRGGIGKIDLHLH